jgi:signal transduction histidine kinase
MPVLPDPLPTVAMGVDCAALLHQLPGFVMITSGPDHVVEFANEGMHALTHFRIVLGRPVRETLPELDEQGFMAIRDEVFRTGEPHRASARPFRLRPASGEPLQEGFMDYVYQPIRAGDGQVRGIIFAGYDVTEQKKLEEQTRMLHFELIQLFRSSVLGAMAMILAHELNQPLTAISNYATAARRLLGAGQAADPEAVSGALSEIEGSARRASEIIRLVREMMGKGRPEGTRVDLAVAIRQGITLGLLDAGRKRVEYRTDLAPGLFVTADPVQIQQVLLNLLRNAVEAVQDGGRRELEIVSARIGDEAEIRVGDSGPGLAGEVRERLFEPFVTTKPQGLGVGLAICRGIVERHGGRIWAEDRPGGGTVFCVRLPLAP